MSAMPKQGDCKKSVHSLVGCVPSFVKIHDIRFASGGRRRKGNGEEKSVHYLVGCVPSFITIHDIRFASGGRRQKGNGEGRFGGDREEGAGKVAEELRAA